MNMVSVMLRKWLGQVVRHDKMKSVTGPEAVWPRQEGIGGDEINLAEDDPPHPSRPLIFTPGP